MIGLRFRKAILKLKLFSLHTQSTVPKKMATGTFTQFLAHENHKIAHKNAQRSLINFKPRIGICCYYRDKFRPPPKKI